MIYTYTYYNKENSYYYESDFPSLNYIMFFSFMNKQAKYRNAFFNLFPFYKIDAFQ